jgi:hypothetical protein
MVKQAMRFPYVNRRVSSLLDDLEVAAVLLAPLLALLLASAMFLPNWFARTSWSHRNTEIIDSPASYVGFLSLWGSIACLALVIGVWKQRWAWLAMWVAAGGFAGAAVVCIGYWQQLRLGLALVDGRERMPARWTMHSPPALPLFIIAATAGLVSALVLAHGCWHARDQE